MSHKMYRICLLMVAVAATAGGILYYCTCEKDVEASRKGTLVDQMENTGNKIKRVGKQVVSGVANALEQTGEEVKNAARNSGREIKKAASVAGHEIKNAAAVTGHEIKNVASVTGHEVKEAAAATGYEWKQTAKAVGREIKSEFSEDSKNRAEQDYSGEYNA